MLLTCLDLPLACATQSTLSLNSPYSSPSPLCIAPFSDSPGAPLSVPPAAHPPSPLLNLIFSAVLSSTLCHWRHLLWPTSCPAEISTIPSVWWLPNLHLKLEIPMSSHLLNITCMSCRRFEVNIISQPPPEAKLAHLHPCPWSTRAPCVIVSVFPARSLSDSMSLLQACFLPFFFKRLCITIYYVLNSTASSTARNSVFYFVTPFVAGTCFLSFISS